MNLQLLKEAAAKAALDYIKPGVVLGIGSGSTVNCFIDALKYVKGKIDAVVVSSSVSAAKIKEIGIPIVDLNTVSELEIYVDGADEINNLKQMIKGGGGALTHEKIVASVSKKFICIADKTKLVETLGNFPIAVEVLPIARSYVARQIVKMGGDPIYREGFVTDNGNVILDIYNLKVLAPLSLEEKLNNITGIVCNGIFASRPADILLLAGYKGIEVL
ncbi:ribose-5-phosphate isomerase RpiA [Gammaproteobacteria bacterium]|nr:ribose-5-phosphate isomerase RpiA [Gammaproteobacteria bacterium]